jgi:hypothetical protein
VLPRVAPQFLWFVIFFKRIHLEHTNQLVPIEPHEDGDEVNDTPGDTEDGGEKSTSSNDVFHDIDDANGVEVRDCAFVAYVRSAEHVCIIANVS